MPETPAKCYRFEDCRLSLIGVALGVIICKTQPHETDQLLTVYVSSAPVGVVLVKGLLAASAMPWPDDTKSRLYVPSVGAETVTWYVSPEPEMPVTGLAVVTGLS